MTANTAAHFRQSTGGCDGRRRRLAVARRRRRAPLGLSPSGQERNGEVANWPSTKVMFSETRTVKQRARPVSSRPTNRYRRSPSPPHLIDPATAGRCRFGGDPAGQLDRVAATPATLRLFNARIVDAGGRRELRQRQRRQGVRRRRISSSSEAILIASAALVRAAPTGGMSPSPTRAMAAMAAAMTSARELWMVIGLPSLRGWRCCFP